MPKQSFQTVCLLCLCHLAAPDGMLPVVNALCICHLAAADGMLPVVDESCVCLLAVSHGMLPVVNELCRIRAAPTCSTLIDMCISLGSQQLLWLSFGWQGLRQCLIPELIARLRLCTGTHETGCSGETRIVLHVSSSSRDGKRFMISSSLLPSSLLLLSLSLSLLLLCSCNICLHDNGCICLSSRPPGCVARQTETASPTFLESPIIAAVAHTNRQSAL